jgi:hypothetical protein
MLVIQECIGSIPSLGRICNDVWTALEKKSKPDKIHSQIILNKDMCPGTPADASVDPGNCPGDIYPEGITDYLVDISNAPGEFNSKEDLTLIANNAKEGRRAKTDG